MEYAVEAGQQALKHFLVFKYGAYFSTKVVRVLGLYGFLWILNHLPLAASPQVEFGYGLWSLWEGLHTASFNARPSYSDFMAVVLLTQFSSDFNGQNAFCAFMFFWIPALLDLLHMLNQSIYYWSEGSPLLTSSLFSFLYTFGPLMITSRVYNFQLI